MRIGSPLVAFAGALLLIVTNAWAGPKEDVANATAHWGETLGTNDPDKVLSVYAADAVLWGTLSPTLRSDRAAIVTIPSAHSKPFLVSRYRSENN